MRLACAKTLRTHTPHAPTEPLRCQLWSFRQQQRRCITGCALPTAVATAAANGHGAREYQTLAEPHGSLLVVKASKFLTTAWPVSNREEARLQLSCAHLVDHHDLRRQNRASSTREAHQAPLAMHCRRSRCQPSILVIRRAHVLHGATDWCEAPLLCAAVKFETVHLRRRWRMWRSPASRARRTTAGRTGELG